MMKYKCNICGAIYDEQGDAAMCHPRIEEVKESEGKYPAVYLREGQRFDFSDDRITVHYTLETIHATIRPTLEYQDPVSVVLYLRTPEGAIFPMPAENLARSLALGVMRLVDE